MTDTDSLEQARASIRDAVARLNSVIDSLCDDCTLLIARSVASAEAVQRLVKKIEKMEKASMAYSLEREEGETTLATEIQAIEEEGGTDA